MNNPDFNALAQRYPHLYLKVEELEEFYSKDPVRLKLTMEIEKYRARIEEYKSRIGRHEAEVDILVAEITRLQAEADFHIAKLDSKRRIARGAVKSERHHIEVARRAILRATTRYGLRNIQLFSMIVNQRLKSEGKALRRSVGRRAFQGLPEAVIELPQVPEPPKDETQKA